MLESDIKYDFDYVQIYLFTVQQAVFLCCLMKTQYIELYNV